MQVGSVGRDVVYTGGVLKGSFHVSSMVKDAAPLLIGWHGFESFKPQSPETPQP